jgi:hypothetical protein
MWKSFKQVNAASAQRSVIVDSALLVQNEVYDFQVLAYAGQQYCLECIDRLIA